MADAFKCRNCGTVVDSPQNCPDCGESAMRPVSRGDASEESSATETDDDASHADEPTTAPEGDATGERTDSGGLLQKLKSLFS